MKTFKIQLAFLAVSVLISCKFNSSAPFPTESVLSEGMKIIAHTPSGTITIEGKKGFTRTYSGENWSRSSVLIPRTTRWYGSLGLYDPAGSNSLGDRLLIDEGKQFFQSESEALRYIQFLSAYYGPMTYNNGGLVIGYKVIDISNEKPTRSLTIWQFYINNTKPKSLRGAVDKNIEISGGTVPDSSIPAQVPIGLERELADKEYNPGKQP